MPKTRSLAGGRPGFLAKPEPVIKITAARCKGEMENDLTTTVRTSDEGEEEMESTLQHEMGKGHNPPLPRRVR